MAHVVYSSVAVLHLKYDQHVADFSAPRNVSVTTRPLPVTALFLCNDSQWESTKTETGVGARPAISCLISQLPVPGCPVSGSFPYFSHLSRPSPRSFLLIHFAMSTKALQCNKRVYVCLYCMEGILSEHLFHRDMNISLYYCTMRKGSSICEQSWPQSNQSELSRLSDCSSQQPIIFILFTSCFIIDNRNITSMSHCWIGDFYCLTSI